MCGGGEGKSTCVSVDESGAEQREIKEDVAGSDGRKGRREEKSATKGNGGTKQCVEFVLY